MTFANEFNPGCDCCGGGDFFLYLGISATDISRWNSATGVAVEDIGWGEEASATDTIDKLRIDADGYLYALLNDNTTNSAIARVQTDGTEDWRFEFSAYAGRATSIDVDPDGITHVGWSQGTSDPSGSTVAFQLTAAGAFGNYFEDSFLNGVDHLRALADGAVIVAFAVDNGGSTNQKILRKLDGSYNALWEVDWPDAESSDHSTAAIVCDGDGAFYRATGSFIRKYSVLTGAEITTGSWPLTGVSFSGWMACDADANLYYADSTDLVCVDSTGSNVFTTAAAAASNATGVVVDEAGNSIWFGSGWLEKLDAAGDSLWDNTSPNVFPRGICLAPGLQATMR